MAEAEAAEAQGEAGRSAAGGVEVLGSWASPFSGRVQMALNLKSIPYQFVQEKLFYADKSPRLLEANPVHKKIPVLIHDGKPVCESLVILQYIDESWNGSGPSILPSDPYDRAIARFWAAYVDEKWFPSFKELEHATEDDERAAIMGRIFEGSALLEAAFVKCSKGKHDFFGGDNIGFLDIAVGSYLGWIQVLETSVGVKLLDETTTPGLSGWQDRFRSHAAVKDVVQPGHKLLEFYMKVKSASKASSG